MQREQRGSGLKLFLLAYHLICVPMAHDYWSVLLIIMIYVPGVASPVTGPINVQGAHHHKEEGCPKKPHPHRRSSPTRTSSNRGRGTSGATPARGSGPGGRSGASGIGAYFNVGPARSAISCCHTDSSIGQDLASSFCYCYRMKAHVVGSVELLRM